MLYWEYVEDETEILKDIIDKKAAQEESFLKLLL